MTKDELIEKICDATDSIFNFECSTPQCREEWACLVSRLEKLLDEYESSKWQPIETAPKDGTPMLLRFVNPNNSLDEWVVEGHYEPDNGDFYINTNYLLRTVAAVRVYRWQDQPTHWAHLPELPAKESEVSDD